jgi:hypothetical protein
MIRRAFVILWCAAAAAWIGALAAPASAQVTLTPPALPVTLPPLTLPPLTLPPVTVPALGPPPPVTVPNLGGSTVPVPASTPSGSTPPPTRPGATAPTTRAGATPAAHPTTLGSRAGAATAAARAVQASPADVTGSIARPRHSGFWSTIGSAAGSIGPWIALLALGIAAQFVVSSAWRDRLRRRVSSD